MKRTLLALGLLLQACAGPEEVDAVGESEAALGHQHALDTAKLARLLEKIPSVCAGKAQLDLEVRGKGLAAWEGKRVYVVAIENDSSASGLSSRRPVVIAGTIAGGAFVLSCLDSMQENYGYPSVAAFIDLDGDGLCGPNDVGFQNQLYGWDRDLSIEVLPAGWASTANLQAPLGNRPPGGFCPGYF